MNHASASPENAIFTRAHAAREIFDKHADKLAESLLAELFGTGQSSRNPHDPKAHVSELAKRLRTLMAANSGSDFDACFADHILADAIVGTPPAASSKPTTTQSKISPDWQHPRDAADAIPAFSMPAVRC